LFTVGQVAVLASKRGCSIKKAGDYAIELQCRVSGALKGLTPFSPDELAVVSKMWGPGSAAAAGSGEWSYASIMAHDKGLWHPVSIFRACREAAGQPHYEVNQSTAKIKNPGGLNEVLIAQIVGADGVRPYLSKQGKYHFKAGENGHGQYHNPADAVALHMFINGYDVAFDYEVPKAETGAWTWPLFAIMCGASGQLRGAGRSYDYRRAVRTLDDAGLLKLTVGPRGGFGTATFQWLPAAYLAVEAPKLDHADAEFLTDLMAVS
jgi:hypothetical protein